MTAATPTLTAWAFSPRSDRALSWRRDRSTWDTVAYRDLALRTRVAAASLDDVVRVGDVVGLLMTSVHELVQGLFATMIVGAVPAVLPPPRLFEAPDSHAERLDAMVALLRPRAVVTSEKLGDAGRRTANASRAAQLFIADLAAGSNERSEPTTRPRDHDALIQFTSGSSGRQRAVRLSATAITTNLEAIRLWLGAEVDDVTVSWLPANHDMGLIGHLMLPIVHQADVWMMSPDEFIRDPTLWLRDISERRGTVSACPPFGLDLCVRSAVRHDLSGIDLRSLRRLVIGAERLTGEQIERFIRFAEPLGFDPRALLPAYGLAEATLAVTGLSPGREMRAVRLLPSSLIAGQRVEVVKQRRLGAEKDDGGGGWLVGSGTPLNATTVHIEHDGRECRPGHLGELVVRGPGVATGYIGDDELTRERFAPGAVRTGDAAVELDGEIFVVGRQGDALKVRGRSVFAEALEVVVVAAAVAEGIGVRSAIVVLGTLGGRDHAIAVVTGPVDEAWAAVALRALKRELQGADVRIVVGRVLRAAVERTSSGKPKRGLLWSRIVTGDAGLEEVSFSEPRTKAADW